MKKILFIIPAILLLAGCAVLKPTERSVDAYYADYSKYAEAGFLISPDPYTGDFESLGEIEILITPAIKEYKGNDGYNSRERYLDYELITHDEIVEIAVEKALAKGANAIVNFSISTENISKGDAWGQIAIGAKYTVKGFCIKRK